MQHRIALVSGGLKLGGSTTFLINFGGELVRRGIPVEVLSFERENPLASDFQKQNIPVLCQDDRRMIFEDRLEGVLEELSRFQPTVVVSTLGAMCFEVLRYMPAGIFRVGMGQSDDAAVYDMMAHYAPWMDLLAVVSVAMKKKAEAMPAFKPVPVGCLPYGVPMDADSELAARDLAAPLRILYLGRLGREQKRVQLFPEIFRQLCESGTPFHWTIAGGGEERSFLEANMKSARLPGLRGEANSAQSVTFTGPVHYSEVPELLKKNDAYLLASDYEGLPLSLLEAMGYGLVPVVSDLESGIRDVVDATNGIRVPVEDVDGYARALIHLHQHRDELAAKSAAARERVKKEFSVAAMTDRWLTTLPPKTAPTEQWPTRWRVRGPVTAGRSLHFSAPIRLLRRIGARFR